MFTFLIYLAPTNSSQSGIRRQRCTVSDGPTSSARYSEVDTLSMSQGDLKQYFIQYNGVFLTHTFFLIRKSLWLKKETSKSEHLLTSCFKPLKQNLTDPRRNSTYSCQKHLSFSFEIGSRRL